MLALCFLVYVQRRTYEPKNITGKLYVLTVFFSWHRVCLVFTHVVAQKSKSHLFIIK